MPLRHHAPREAVLGGDGSHELRLTATVRELGDHPEHLCPHLGSVERPTRAQEDRLEPRRHTLLTPARANADGMIAREGSTEESFAALRLNQRARAAHDAEDSVRHLVHPLQVPQPVPAPGAQRREQLRGAARATRSAAAERLPPGEGATATAIGVSGVDRHLHGHVATRQRRVQGVVELAQARRVHWC